ncbi:MAG: pyridoxamine 5'-phosphate oxidase family protein [Desulfofustis sp.]
MKLAEYLDFTTGVGILSTANNAGEVNAAVYSRPHILDRDIVAFIMRERLSRANLLENRQAHYLFLEENSKSRGLRLHLDMIEETDDIEEVKSFSRNRYLVTFKVTKVLALLGPREIELE